jgi:hypothetical protein
LLYVTYIAPLGVATVPSRLAFTWDPAARLLEPETNSGGQMPVHELEVHVGVPPLSAESRYSLCPSGAARTDPTPDTDVVATVIGVAEADGEPPDEGEVPLEQAASRAATATRHPARTIVLGAFIFDLQARLDVYPSRRVDRIDVIRVA